ncbi:hypothetical protein [Actinopolyspora erythraea]|uniref:hypothetical protein n=1 Tax=Actinopolyspora erythraea TaxID=414996 RepID=UPI000694614C|nr:hypothetical protein [Actinopolyspora erythraea]
MASNCFTPIRGRRMRLTRVDNVGRPIYGTCSSVTTKGFVSVDISSENEDGEETTVKTASGELCVSEKSCDQLKWYTVEMVFCLVDPDLATLVNPMWETLYDYRGDSIGWAETYTQNCETGFALEVWCDVTGYTPQDPHAQGAWLYYLLPFVIGGNVGDETIENGALNLTLSGRTKKATGWGRGPYPVMLNPPATAGAAPQPGPLLTPIGPDEPRRRFLTTVRPPDPQCGCQPLSAPDGPSFSVTEATSDTTRMSVTVRPGAAEGQFRVQWGDDSAEQALPLDGATHRYGEEGTYLVQVWPQGSPNRVRVVAVTVPFTGPVKPALHVAEDPSDSVQRRSVIATVDNHGNGEVVLDWGDGASTTHPGDGSEATHTYPRSGTFTVRATDADTQKVFSEQTVVVPFGQAKPTITATTSGLTATVTVDNHNLGPVRILWGDDSDESSNPGDGTSETTHTYAAAGEYTITAYHAKNPSVRSTTTVTVTNELTLTVVESDPPGDPRRKVTATWDNAGHGTVKITWQSGGTATTGLPVSGSQDHTYSADGTYTITVTDEDDATRTASAEVTVPFSTP